MNFATTTQYLSKENQDAIRTNFVTWLRNNPHTYDELAAKMGLHRVTVCRFLTGHETNLKTLSKIELFLEAQ